MSSAEPGGGRKSSGKSDRFTKRRRQRLKRTRSDGYVLNLSSAEGAAPPSPNDGDATAARPPSDGGEEDGTAFLWWIRSPTVQSLGRLRRAIRSNDRDWIKGFLDFDGLGLLFQCLKNLAPQSSQQHRHHLSDMVLRMECVMCIREVVNSQTGLDCLLSMRQRRDDIFGRRFASVLQTKNVMVKMQIFELLSALCLYSKDGYYLTLDALEKYKTWQKFSYRFSLLVNELHAADLTPFKISIMALINSILFTNEKLRDRMRIRNEFLALNIQEIIVAVVKSDADPDLQVQCDVFEDEMAADNEAFEEIRESESINIGSHQELFHAIFMRVQQTPLAAPFLSLLQSLFQINAADLQCEAVWNRLEHVVQKIVAAEVGDNSQLELGSSLPSSTSQYQDIGVQTDVSQPQAMSEPLREQKGAAADISPDGETLASSTSSPIICSIPPPPPLPASMAPPPAPITGVPPPPPPPLLLGNSAPSATHPPPSAGNTPVPPPPPPGLVRTPCFDLPSIQTRDPQCKMRTFSWNKVPTSALSGVSIWKDVLKMSDSIDVKYEKLEELFGQKDAPPAAEKQLGKSLRSHGMSAEISLIDPKKSMNINIFLKQFRKSNEEIIQLIENADSRAFGVEKLKGLMKLLPQQDEVDLIEHFDGEYEKLGSAEKFYCQLIKIPSYKTRIEAMLLKGDFSSQLCMIQPNIQILNSVNLCLIDNSSLKDFLRLVLHTGNFINKGSAGGNAYGFRISSLNKLVMTRSNVPRISLLHHLVEEAEKQDEHALKFVDDLLEPLQKASRFSLESIKTEFNQLRTNVHQLKGQLEHTEKEVFDHFKEFLQSAEAELENIGTSVEQIDKTSEKLAQHYCENLRSFNLCEFLNTFREFCEKVKTCQQENENRLQQIQNAERRKRAQEELLEKRKGFQKQEEKKKIVDNLVNEIKRGKVLRRLSLRKKVVKLAPAELEESYL